MSIDKPFIGADKQFTRPQAVRAHNTIVWRHWKPREIISLQLFQSQNCVPPSVYRKAMFYVFKKNYLTQNPTQPELAAEFLKGKPVPALDECLKNLDEDTITYIFYGNDTLHLQASK